MKMKLFTPGPVSMNELVLKSGSGQLPYFRTEEFSNITFKLLAGLKKIIRTSGDMIILTSSGTGAMESAIINFVTPNNNVLIINGGNFGERWNKICIKNKIVPYNYIVSQGKKPDYNDIEKYIKLKKISVIIATAHETSTGFLFDIKKLGKFSKKYNLFFMVDAISSVLADEYLMDDWNVDVTIFSSQKALALPPGLSFLGLSMSAIKKIKENEVQSYYFDLKEYLNNLKRGQLPFTPAINIMLMLQKRIEIILEKSVGYFIEDCHNKANFFRKNIENLPFEIFPEVCSNAITCLKVEGKLDASYIVKKLKEKYNIFITPNAKPNAKKLFRISHLGEQSIEDLNFLLTSLKKII